MTHPELKTVYALVGATIEGYNQSRGENYMWTMIGDKISIYPNNNEFDAKLLYFVMQLTGAFDMKAKFELDNEDEPVLLIQ